MTQDARVQEFVTAFEGLRAEVEKVIYIRLKESSRRPRLETP